MLEHLDGGEGGAPHLREEGGGKREVVNSLMEDVATLMIMPSQNKDNGLGLLDQIQHFLGGNS